MLTYLIRNTNSSGAVPDTRERAIYQHTEYSGPSKHGFHPFFFADRSAVNRGSDAESDADPAE